MLVWHDVITKTNWKCHGGRNSASPLVMGMDVVSVAEEVTWDNAVGRRWVWRSSVVWVRGDVLRRGSGALTRCLSACGRRSGGGNNRI